LSLTKFNTTSIFSKKSTRLRAGKKEKSKKEEKGEKENKGYRVLPAPHTTRKPMP
jgi:hypothetical protein